MGESLLDDGGFVGVLGYFELVLFFFEDVAHFRIIIIFHIIIGVGNKAENRIECGERWVLSYNKL